MKAMVRRKYGAPKNVLVLSEIERPVIEADEVLVRVQAASVNIGDVYGVMGVPKVMRPIFSAMEAKSHIPGTDIAGTVESVGDDVNRFRPGDEVFGSCKGAFAEYAAAAEDALVRKPAVLGVEEAAAVGVSAFTALQALRDHGKLQAGQKVLINGASGGVGTFAVQIAKSMGAEVTAVCSTRNLDLVQSIGADHVIDYTQTDFTQGGPKYDLVFDNVGKHSLKRTRQAVADGGLLLANGAPVGGWFGGLTRPLRASIDSFFVNQQGRPFVSTATKKDLESLCQLAEAGDIKPVIDRTCALSDAADAMAHVGTGHAQGKTVITI